MMHGLNHTEDRGVILFHNGVVHFAETEGVESTLLHCGAVDAAFNLFDCYLCHTMNYLPLNTFSTETLLFCAT